jgi:hypothetical protein
VSYSTATQILMSVLGYGALVLGMMILWRKTSKEQEDYLLLKMFGYTVLAMFRFSLNQIHLPAGLLIAYLIYRRAKQNKTLKAGAILLGGLLFIASFLPIQDSIEQALYPRDDITTYLHEQIEEGIGFNLGISSQGKSIAFYTERDDLGVNLYEALYDAKKAEEPVRSTARRYEIVIMQDHKDDRFRRIQIEVGDDKAHLFLKYEDRVYVFRASPEFERLFAEAM